MPEQAAWQSIRASGDVANLSLSAPTKTTSTFAALAHAVQRVRFAIEMALLRYKGKRKGKERKLRKERLLCKMTFVIEDDPCFAHRLAHVLASEGAYATAFKHTHYLQVQGSVQAAVAASQSMPGA